MQTHFSPRTLKGTDKPEKDVQVLFAVNPDRKGMLFIHGYSGYAIKTWSDFHELLPGSSKCAGSDIFFYGYDGLRANMQSSASIFRSFLDRVLRKPEDLFKDNLPKSMQRAKDFAYDEFIIVAHSLGAVIARRALIDATMNKSDWVKKTKLILYAPAHKGASVAELALEVSSSFTFLKFFGIAARFKSPLIDDLKPDSRALKTLLEDTQNAIQEGSNEHLIANRVVIAEYENIVRNERFCYDPPADTIPNTTHTTVCKPNKSFLKPLTILEDCL